MDEAERLVKGRKTAEIYRDLLYVEMKSLVTRVAELTTTVNDVFGELHSLALQLEGSMEKVDQLDNRINFVNSELRDVRKLINSAESKLLALTDRVQTVESVTLEKITDDLVNPETSKG